jgi:DNA-nicking Smr family endonuclease
MSGDGGKNKPRRRKLLSEEDVALWNIVAQSIGPAKGKSRVREVEVDADATVDAPADAHQGGPGDPRQPPAVRAKHNSAVPVIPSAQKATPAPAAAKARLQEPKSVPLERRKARRIARGTDEIEARLDLHGMTQDDAHRELVGFVRRCQAAGFRTVLVITGKGGPLRRHPDDGDDYDARPRGVLRRNVPRWLAGPEIGALVVNYTTAHVRHGGEGALYVQLRRKG